jgi:hypothetical protein
MSPVMAQLGPPVTATAIAASRRNAGAYITLACIVGLETTAGLKAVRRFK